MKSLSAPTVVFRWHGGGGNLSHAFFMQAGRVEAGEGVLDKPRVVGARLNLKLYCVDIFFSTVPGLLFKDLSRHITKAH